MTIVIFLGPSLPLAEAKAILPEALYRPPIAQGQLVALLDEMRPDAIGIIDGVFFRHTAVWHKEILLALEQGIPVLGASSMGALRAAECTAFGMVGVGRVFELYASGELTGDDEVALMHADADLDWVGLSEPLVNVRATLAAAVAEGRLAAHAAERAIAAAKALYFPRRTKSAILAAAAAVLTNEELRALEQSVERHYVDIKRADAVALLERLRAGEVERTAVTLNRSLVFTAFRERDRIVRRESGPIRAAQITRHAAIEHPRFNELLEHALDRLLVEELAVEWKVEVSEEEIADELARFCWRRQLENEQALAEWQTANDLDREGFQHLIEREAVARRLRTWVRMRRGNRQLVEPLLDELRLRGEYAEWADRAAAVSVAAELASLPAEPSAADELIARQMLATGWRPDPPLERAIAETGFDDLDDLLSELASCDRARGRDRARGLDEAA